MTAEQRRREAGRTVVAEFAGRELAQYNTGEKRIEHEASGGCSEWLHWRDADRIESNAAIMAGWPLDALISDGKTV